jgi:phenylalanyl-tRNA synthetase beta subunit
MISEKEKVYYDMQNILNLFLKKIGVDKYEYKKSENCPSFAHAGRTAQIIIRGQFV